MHQDGLAHLLSLVPNHEAEKYSLVCKQWYYLVNHELRVRRNNFGMSVDSLVWKPFNTKNMPSSRFSATMKPHPFKPSTLILFGGESDPIKYYNDVYFLDLGNLVLHLGILMLHSYYDLGTSNNFWRTAKTQRISISRFYKI